MDIKIIIVIIIVVFIFSLVSFIMALIIKSQQKVAAYKIEKKEMEILFNQTLLNSQIEIQEQTMQTIAQEIHDNIGQMLSLVKLNITDIETDSIFNENKMQHAATILTKAIQDLRDVSAMLNTDNIKKIGFDIAIKKEIDIVAKSGIDIHLLITGNRFRLLAQTELILFRMVQESINNCIKHSKATTINVAIGYENNKLAIDISDNGIGFVETNITKGQGLNNLEYRAKLINAQVFIKSSINKGTTINISIINFV
jgi:two-component system, NarL family, sensor kinase